MRGVRGVRALLGDRPGSRRRPIQLEPLDAGVVGVVCVDGVVEDERFACSEVSVLQVPHRPVRKRLEGSGRSRLRHAVVEEVRPGTEILVARRRRQGRKGGERRVRRDAPVDVEGEEVDAIGAAPEAAVDCSGVEVRSSGRRRRAVEVARQQDQRRTGGVEGLERGRVAGEHLRPVEGDRVQAPAGEAPLGAQVVGVRPDAELGIVVREVELEQVEEPAARDGVRRLRYRDALEGRRGLEAVWDRELAHHPAIGEVVIDDDRVPVVVLGAGVVLAGGNPELVDVGRAGQRVALLVEDLELRVDHLDVVAGTDVAVRVGRNEGRVADAVEVGIRRGELLGRDCRSPDLRSHAQHPAVHRGSSGGPDLGVLLALVVIRGSARHERSRLHPRKRAQVDVQRDRRDRRALIGPVEDARLGTWAVLCAGAADAEPGCHKHHGECAPHELELRRRTLSFIAHSSSLFQRLLGLSNQPTLSRSGSFDARKGLRRMASRNRAFGTT